MRCDAVIAITIQYGTGNQELIAGDAAMAKKYAQKRTDANNPIYFQNRTATAGDVVQVIGEVIATHGDHLRQVRSKGGTVGLYWALHGDEADTQPPAADLAGLTYRFYAEGITFSKINLSACYSGGRAAHKDLNASVLMRYCTTLSQALAQEGHEKDLDQLMVAGYREVVVMWDGTADADHFFTQSVIQPAQNVDGVYNTYKNNGKYHPMRPRVSHPQAQSARELVNEVARREALDVRKKNKETLSVQENKDLKGLMQYKGGHKTERDLFDAVARYVLGKVVLRYSAASNIWTPASLVDYSDSMAISQIVTEIEPLVNNGLAAHIKV
jgi:hypothetical protein